MPSDATYLRGRVTPPPERLCTATRRDGERCHEWTADARIKVCHWHGGAAFDRKTGQWKGWRPAVTGRYSQAVANIPQMEELYLRALEDEDLMETREEIALARAYLSRLLEKGTNAVVSGEMLPNVVKALDTVDKMVSRRHQRLHGANLTITVRDWEALVTRVLDMTHEFFGDSDRYADFVRALANMNQPRNQVIEQTALPAAVVEETPDGGPG